MKTFLIAVAVINVMRIILVALLVSSSIEYPRVKKFSRGDDCATMLVGVTWLMWSIYLLKDLQ